MLRYVILAITLMVGMAPWQASAQDEASLRGGVGKSCLRTAMACIALEQVSW